MCCLQVVQESHVIASMDGVSVQYKKTPHLLGGLYRLILLEKIILGSVLVNISTIY